MRRQINTIFCATDFSKLAEEVVAYGITLAKEFNAKLIVCHVVDFPTVSMYGEAVSGPIEHQNRFMDYARSEISRLVGNESIDSQALVTLGNTTEEIFRLVVEFNADLVITATHGRSGLKRFFLGSVTERLMRTLPCPLLVLRGTEDGSEPKLQRFPFKRILVGCDFSSDSDLAFKNSLSMAQEFESELHMVHVVEPSGYKDLFKIPAEQGDKFKQDLFDMIKGRLKSMVPDEALNWLTLQTHLLVGKPYAEIIRYAEINDIDLIALGIRGHGMVEDLLVGSTTDRVIRRAPCPVLSICQK
ncbi:MAG: universal stress protein [Desulfobacteraceae bacterium]|nr:universal stress protein [Desulfobacteraceae bacterium]MBC2756334.1 universal stress protein [Desulfobacteraceae bacterium]